MSEAERQERLFKGLADATRRQILDLLRDRPRTTGDVCSQFPDLDRCTVMQHLGVLEKADLIIVKREGRVRWNYLNVITIREVYDRWISPYASTAVDVFTRMRRDMSEGA